MKIGISPHLDRTGGRRDGDQEIEMAAQIPGLGHKPFSRSELPFGDGTHWATEYYTMKIGNVYPPICPFLTSRSCPPEDAP